MNAVEMGRAAAESLLAGREAARAFTPLPKFWSEQHGVRIQGAGIPALAQDTVPLTDSGPINSKVTGYVAGGSLVGVLAWDSPRGMLHWSGELARQTTEAMRTRLGQAQQPAPQAGPAPGSTVLPSLPVHAMRPDGQQSSPGMPPAMPPQPGPQMSNPGMPPAGPPPRGPQMSSPGMPPAGPPPRGPQMSNPGMPPAGPPPPPRGPQMSNPGMPPVGPQMSSPGMPPAGPPPPPPRGPQMSNPGMPPAGPPPPGSRPPGRPPGPPPGTAHMSNPGMPPAGPPGTGYAPMYAPLHASMTGPIPGLIPDAIPVPLYDPPPARNDPPVSGSGQPADPGVMELPPIDAWRQAS
jgi:hypothetical protein